MKRRIVFLLTAGCVWFGAVLLSRAEWILQPKMGSVPLADREKSTLLLAQSAVALETSTDGLKDGNAVRPAMMVMKMSLPAVDPGGDLVGSLARQLEYDWQRIYWYVSNRIKMEPYIGLTRSPERVLLDGAGTPVEQAYLFSELLRRTGKATCFGTIELMFPVQADGALDICDLTGMTNYSDAYELLVAGGLAQPGQSPLQSDSSVNIFSVLTGVEINGGFYYLAPWCKSHTVAGMVDLKSTMGYVRTNLLDAAGGSSGSGWVRGLTDSAVTNLLNQYAGNLRTFFQTNAVSISEAYPISQVVPSDAVLYLDGYSPTSLTNAWNIDAGATPQLIFSSSNLPPQTLNICETAHKKISILFETNGAHRAKIYVDGTTKTNWMEGGTGGTNGAPFLLTVAVTNAGTTNINIASYSLKRGSRYVLCQSFGTGCAGDMSGTISKNITALKQQGFAEESTEVFTESLRYTGQRWMDQMSATVESVPVLTGMKHVMQYQFGIMAGETNGFYIDVKQQYKFGNIFANRFSFTDMFIGSALEHSVLEQLQPGNAKGTSTIRVLKQANTTNLPVYRATSNNWASITNSLSGYDLASIKSNIDKGAVYILPKTNSVSIAQWTGGGHVMYFPDSRLQMAVGLYDGGVNALNTRFQSTILQTSTKAVSVTPIKKVTVPNSFDPVDMQTGAFLFDHTDLEVSSPLPLTLHRSYRSDASENSTMGSGWTHSFNIRVAEYSAIDQSFGQRSAEDMVPYLVGASVVQDLLDNESTAKDWVAASLVADWTVQQLTGNGVSISLGSKALTFVKQPDGSYTPPPGMTVSLIRTNGVYVMQERNASKYTFNTNNLIAAIADPDGNTLTFSYNAQTNLQTVASSFGPSLTFNYTSNRLTSVSDSARTVYYQYDAKNNLTNFTDAAGKNWGIAYSNTNHPHAITSLKDPENITTIQNFYNAFGQVTNQISATGQPYDLFITDYISVERDPLGYRTAYVYDDKGRTVQTQKPDGAQQFSRYDGWDRVTNTVNEAGVTNVLTYDINHNLLEKREAAGMSEERTTEYHYDALHRLISVSTALTPLTVLTNEFEYDSEHHLTKTIDALGNETLFEYWPDGQLKKKTEDGGRVTEYAYDTAGNPDTITSTDAGTVDLNYNTRGELIQKTDARGQTTDYLYDANGKVLAVSTFLTPSTALTVSNSYWNNGLLKTVTDAKGQTVSNVWNNAYKPLTVCYPDGGTVSNTYDAADRLIATKNTKGSITSNTLDAVGRITASHSPFVTRHFDYDVIGNLTNSVVDPSDLNLWTRSAYDALNRPITRHSPLATEAWQYDSLSRMTNRIDQAAKHWGAEYDALGRKTENLRPSGATEQFVYDALGNRIGFYNAEGKPITFGFDAQGRVTAITNAIGRVTRLAYDLNGNMTNRLDSMSRSTGYVFDGMNRIDRIIYPDSSETSFEYDPNGNVLQVSNFTSQVSFSYDSMNRLASSLISVNSRSFAVTNSYDLNGNRTNIVYPGGLVVGYSYDEENRLAGVSATGLGLSALGFGFGYDGASRLTSMSYPNGVNSAFGYDAESRVTGYSHSGSSNFISRAIARDPRGFKTSENITAGLEPVMIEGEQRFTNNSADQLTKITQRDTWLGGELNQWYERTYTYDDNGCLTQEDVSRPAWNTNSAIHEYTTDYTWDYDNRLTEVSGQGSEVSYIYDASGVRIGRVHNAVTNYFVIDYNAPLKMPLAETDAEGNITRYYIWSSHGLLAHIDAVAGVADPGSIRYYHADEQGSTLALTDESGAVTDQFAYTPYGGVTRTGTTDTPFQWLGGIAVQNEGDGLYYMLNRYYSATTKKFISADPMGIDGGVNLYSYANLNPLANVDPFGLCAHTSGSSSFTMGNVQNTVSRITGLDSSYKPPSTYQTPMLSNYVPGRSSPAPTLRSYQNSQQSLAHDALLIGSSARNPVLAQANAAPFAIIGGGALLGGGSSVLLPAIKAASAPATTYYLQNAPQINDVAGGFIDGFVPSGAPDVGRSPQYNIFWGIGNWTYGQIYSE